MKTIKKNSKKSSLTSLKPLNLIFLGLQGSGKGTQAMELKKKFPFKDIELGAVLRRMIKTKKGPREIFKIVTKGKLVPTRITEKIMEKEISKIPARYPLIVDGFPRALEQVYALNRIFKKTGRDNNYYAVYFDISKKTAILRLLNRWTCPKCNMVFSRPKKKCPCGGKPEKRQDETPALIKNRLKFVSKYLRGIKNYYKKEGRLIEINAERPVSKITRDLINSVGLK